MCTSTWSLKHKLKDGPRRHAFSFSGFFKMSKLILFHYSKGKNYDSTDGSNDIYDKYKRSCHIRILLPLY